MNIDYNLLGEQLDTMTLIESELRASKSPRLEHLEGVCNLIGEMISEDYLRLATVADKKTPANSSKNS